MTEHITVGVGAGAKHYWMPLVVGGALILALAVWTIRRQHGGGAIERAAKQSR